MRRKAKPSGPGFLEGSPSESDKFRFDLGTEAAADLVLAALQRLNIISVIGHYVGGALAQQNHLRMEQTPRHPAGQAHQLRLPGKHLHPL